MKDVTGNSCQLLQLCASALAALAGKDPWCGRRREWECSESRSRSAGSLGELKVGDRLVDLVFHQKRASLSVLRKLIALKDGTVLLKAVVSEKDWCCCGVVWVGKIAQISRKNACEGQ